MTLVLNNFNRTQLLRFIAAELIIMAAVLAAIYNISWGRIIERHEDTCSAAIIASAYIVEDCSAEAAAAASEEIMEERDGTLWVKEDGIHYRTGPDTRYLSVGTLEEDQSVDLFGVTYNDWSLVGIHDDQYYVKSSNLTSDPPYNIAAGTKGEYQKYALSLMGDYGWADTEITPLISLWNRESGWNPSSHNSSSGAHGIPQALPASKMASEGADYYTNGETQIRWGLNYIRGRYGSPSAAWSHFCSCGWY